MPRKKMVKELLIKNVEQIAVQEVRTIHNNHIESESVSESKTDDMLLGEKKIFSNNENDIVLFGENETIDNDTDTTIIERAKYEAKQEVLSYLISIEKIPSPKEEFDPLKWW